MGEADLKKRGDGRQIVLCVCIRVLLMSKSVVSCNPPTHKVQWVNQNTIVVVRLIIKTTSPFIGLSLIFNFSNDIKPIIILKVH